MHLAIDGYEGDSEKLWDVDLVRCFLNDYPSEIGMNKIIDPQVHIYRGEKQEDWGVSGFVLIAESHISVHTFPLRGYVNIDIFSCKAFDPTSSLARIKSTFSLPNVKVWTLERGLEYSTVWEARAGMEEERVDLVSGTPGLDA